MNQLFKFIPILIFAFACSKKQVRTCDRHIEINDRQHLVDISALNQAPELLDTLNKYPELRVFKVIADEYAIGMQCDIFYRDLIIFTDQYVISKGKKHPVIGPPGAPEINDTIPLSLNPTLTFEQALSIARKEQHFGSGCLNYRLGIYNTNQITGAKAKEYRLVWKLEAESKFPVAIIDAHTGEVHYSHDGIEN